VPGRETYYHMVVGIFYMILGLFYLYARTLLLTLMHNPGVCPV